VDGERKANIMTLVGRAPVRWGRVVAPAGVKFRLPAFAVHG